MVLIFVSVKEFVKFLKIYFYLDFYSYCHVFSSEPITKIFSCAPSISWFTIIAFFHVIWISGLCITVIAQVIYRKFLLLKLSFVF
jgi:hypothetical protein